MASRVIKDSETDATSTFAFGGDLLEIDGPGSLQTPAILAQNGATFTMTAGATLTVTGAPDMDPTNGPDALFINGTASIDGAVVSAAGSTAIGNTYNGATAAQGTGTLTVSGGAKVTDTYSNIGNWNVFGQDVGSLTLTGAGTTWQDNGDPAINVLNGAMVVGASGIGHLKIQSGATAVERTFAVLGNSSADAKGDAIVDGAGSTWKIGTNLVIGALGTGTLTVSNKGTVSVRGFVALAYSSGGNGTATIDSGATLGVTGILAVGRLGIGTLSVMNGGTVTAAEIDVSYDVGSSGTVTVDGAQLTSSGPILVGKSDPGSLELHKAAQAKGTDVTIGYASATMAQSSAVIDSNATLAASGTLTVGLSGPGTLDISDNGTVTANVFAVAASANGGPATAPSGVQVGPFGKGAVLSVATDASIGSTAPVPDVPPDINGQFGRWKYSAGGYGGIILENDSYLSIGHSLNLQEPNDPKAPESLWVMLGGSAEIGGNSGATPGTLTIDSGGVLAGHGRVIVADGFTGALTNHSLVNNGSLVAQDGTLTIDADVSGTGTVEISQDAACDIDGAFTGTVEFNGAYDTTLRLEQPDQSKFTGTLSDLQIGDVISLKTDALPGAPGNQVVSHAVISGSSLDLTFTDGTTWSYALSGDYSGDTFTSHLRVVGGTVYDELVLEPASPKIATGFSGAPSHGLSPYVDALIWGWGQWDPSKGPITYWFGDQNDVKPAVLAHGETNLLRPDTTVHTWRSDQEAAFESAVSVYASVSDLTFQPASSADTADVIEWLEPGVTDIGGDPILGKSEVPADVAGGALWQFFDDTDWVSDPNQLKFGGVGEFTAIHEIGHMLGLAHPGDGGTEPDATQFPPGPVDFQNQTVFTVMSSTPGWNGVSFHPTGDDGHQGKLGALDIAAIQAMYGQNMTTGAGDTVYNLQTTNAVGTGWQAIWDPSGLNTISNAGGTDACVIDLRAAPLIAPNAGGYPSYVVGVQGGFTIAHGTEIDHAIGGTDNDLFQTNAGPDVIDGGGGLDRVLFAQNFSDYNLFRSSNTITVKLGTVTDTLHDIQILSFADRDVRASDIACFAEGTRIATDRGEIAVEALRPGDQVLALAGKARVKMPIVWIGRRHIDLARHSEPSFVQPIRIERDAFADNVPHTDLLLSPDHAVLMDGMLICIRQLVNGSTIRIERGWTAVDYYHVELDEHAILLAEGLTVESYLDTGNRGFFANAGAPLVLHPDLTNEADHPTREAGSCAPFVSDEASVRPVWQRLADRAAAIGHAASSQWVTTTDANLRLLTDRHTVKPIFSDSNRVIFVLPHGAREVRLVSRAQSPTEARPWLSDQRRLGVRAKRIVLRGTGEMREVPMDHPDLNQGWWGIEQDGPMMSRWTDGEAVLPLPAMRGHVILEIHLAGAMTFVQDAVLVGGAERRAAA